MIRRAVAWYGHARRWGHSVWSALGVAFDMRGHEPYVANPYGDEE